MEIKDISCSRMVMAALALAMLALFVMNIFVGSTHIPPSQVWEVLGACCGCSEGHVAETTSFIILHSRLPQAIVAVFCGASLSVAGLMLQTAFRNPLAGPSVFGITGGASLAVAIVTLAIGTSTAIGGQITVVVAAFVGATAVTAIILALSAIVRSGVMLLIVGIMIGYLSSSAITLLNYFASADGMRSYMLWGMGDFGAVSSEQLPMFVTMSVFALRSAVLLVKPLNALLLGERYAESLGVNIVGVRNWLLLSTGLLSAVATAYCGPVSFLGLAVPHIARLLMRTENHKLLMPVTMVCGAAIALLCNLLTTVLSDGVLLPLNAITPLIGAPVIIYVVLRKR